MGTTSTNDGAVTAWIGLDVSKAKLDVCLLRAVGKAQHKQFSNDGAGHARLLPWVQQVVGQEPCH